MIWFFSHLLREYLTRVTATFVHIHKMRRGVYGVLHTHDKGYLNAVSLSLFLSFVDDMAWKFAKPNVAYAKKRAPKMTIHPGKMTICFAEAYKFYAQMVEVFREFGRIFTKIIIKI